MCLLIYMYFYFYLVSMHSTVGQRSKGNRQWKANTGRSSAKNHAERENQSNRNHAALNEVLTRDFMFICKTAAQLLNAAPKLLNKMYPHVGVLRLDLLAGNLSGFIQ